MLGKQFISIKIKHNSALRMDNFKIACLNVDLFDFVEVHVLDYNHNQGNHAFVQKANSLGETTTDRKQGLI
jgi:hypothetical protein